MDILREALRDIRDTQRHVDRKAVYGSNGHFPIPNPNRNFLLISQQRQNSLPKTVHNIYEQSAKNKQTLDNLQAIAELFKEDLKVQVS